MKNTILDRLFFNQRQQELEGLGVVVSTYISQQVDAVDGGKADGNQPARLHRVIRLLEEWSRHGRLILTSGV